MSKKLINSPEDAVDEALAGLVATHPGLRLLEGHRVIIRADTETVIKEGKVSIRIMCPNRDDLITVFVRCNGLILGDAPLGGWEWS